MRYFIMFIALCCVNTSFAREDMSVTRNNFAYGYNLEIDGDGAIYSLYLNEKIYQGLLREDRGDLRIFNSVGEVVPHDIRRFEKTTKKSVAEKTLPYFPLFKNNKSETINTMSKNIHITTNDHGTIIDLNYGALRIKKRLKAAYIIDASSLKNTPNHLLLDWDSTNENFILKLHIEGSDDLDSWRKLTPSTTISNMKWAEHTLVQRKIKLPGAIPNYLRISWTGNEEFKLNTLTAHFSDTYQAQTRQWSVFLPAKFDKFNSSYYYNTQSVIPIDRINVQLPIKNTLVNVLIESSPTRDGPWFSRYRGLLYDLQFDENRLVNANIHQTVNSHRHWRVQILNGGELGAKPQLRLGWIPEQLLFVATGESPFTLTYGSAHVDAITAPLGILLSESVIKQQGRLIKAARLGVAIDFDNRSSLEPEKPELDWKKYILWAVLILGVLLLAFMAFRLFKQMGQVDSSG